MATLTHKNEALPARKDVTLITLEGSIDCNNILFFEGLLKKQGKGKHLVLDLKNLTYLNSTAVGALINFVDAQLNLGLEVFLLNINPRLKPSFDMLGLCAYVKERKSIEEILAELPAPNGNGKNGSYLGVVEAAEKHLLSVQKELSALEGELKSLLKK